MADSDNSRTLPSVTHTPLLQIADMLEAHAARAEIPGDGAVDPAFAGWRAWLAANRDACEKGRRQARLERRLAETVGFPQIALAVPGQDEPVIVSDASAIDRLLGNEPETVAARANAKAELAAKQRAREEADRRLGYSRALRAESRAQDEEEERLEALWDMPARTCVGAAAKLHAMVRAGEPWEGCPELPWPQLRSLLADLLRIDA